MLALAIVQTAKTHVVRKGESLSNVASRYDCTTEDIKAWNHLNNSRLKTGQKLTVYISVNISDSTVKNSASADSTSNSSSQRRPSLHTSTTSDGATTRFSCARPSKRVFGGPWAISKTGATTTFCGRSGNQIKSLPRSNPLRRFRPTTPRGARRAALRIATVSCPPSQQTRKATPQLRT